MLYKWQTTIDSLRFPRAILMPYWSQVSRGVRRRTQTRRAPRTAQPQRRLDVLKLRATLDRSRARVMDQLRGTADIIDARLSAGRLAMTGIRAMATLAFLAWAAPAVAALSISGTVVFEPHPSTLLRGQEATVTYIITNTGDEPLDYAGAGFAYRTFGPLSTLFPFPTEGTPPCGFRLLDLSTPPGVPGFVANTVDFSPVPIQPGESRQCTAGLRISAETAGPFVQRFAFSGSRDGRSVSSQQHVVFALGEPPLAISALTIWGFTFASLAVLLAGLHRLPR